MTAVEISVAARMQGIESYGKYVFLLRQGRVAPPPIEEINAAMKGVKKPRGKNTGRRVVQYSKETGERIADFADTLEAAHACKKTCRTQIYQACEGHALSAHGYQWRYEGDEPPGPYKQGPHQLPLTVTEKKRKHCRRCGAEYLGLSSSWYCSSECRAAAMRQSRAKYARKVRAQERDKRRAAQERMNGGVENA